MVWGGVSPYRYNRHTTGHRTSLHGARKAFCERFICCNLSDQAGILQVIWQVIRTLWLTSAFTLFVGFLVLPRSARDACAHSIAEHLEFSGHALSGTATNLLPPAAHPCSRSLAKYACCRQQT